MILLASNAVSKILVLARYGSNDLQQGTFGAQTQNPDNYYIDVEHKELHLGSVISPWVTEIRAMGLNA